MIKHVYILYTVYTVHTMYALMGLVPFSAPEAGKLYQDNMLSLVKQSMQ